MTEIIRVAINGRWGILRDEQVQAYNNMLARPPEQASMGGGQSSRPYYKTAGVGTKGDGSEVQYYFITPLDI